MKTLLMALLAIFINTTTNAQCDPGCCTPEEWPICAPLCALAADAPNAVDAITTAVNEAGAELSALVTGSSASAVDCPTRPGCVCPGGKAAPTRDQAVQFVDRMPAEQSAPMLH